MAVISSPRFGILNLKGETALPLITEDAEALRPIIGQPDQTSEGVPACDILFLYCDIELNGKIQNSTDGLREIIRDSGAVIVVVASENHGESYIAAGKDKGYGKANLVMTLERNGNVFPTFFRKLFSEMKNGVSMPVAWVKLAPQIPGQDHLDCPGTIFSCEAGQVTFG